MFYVVRSVLRRTVPSLLWLATGADSEFWQTSRALKVMQGVFLMPFRSSYPAIDSGVSSPIPSHLIETLSRPSLVRASTTATLVHVDIDFTYPDSLRKPTTGKLKGGDLAYCGHLSSKSTAQVEDGNFNRDAPIINAASPPGLVQPGRRNNRTWKNMAARWAPKALERGIRANRPVTGVERLACLRRLNLAI